MGHKTHPVGFRLGIIKDWQARWFAGKEAEYRTMLEEDMHIRQALWSQYSDAGISRIEIERSTQEITVTIHTARPGMVIGRGGKKVEEIRHKVEERTGKKVKLNVQEVRQPELDAYLVAKNIAEQLERRIAFRRVMRQVSHRTMQAGAQGIKVVISGRIAGAEIARREKWMEGKLPLHTLRADIDYGFAEALTTMGKIGVKVWIYKGEVLPEKKEAEEIPTIEVVLKEEEESHVAAEAGEVPQSPSG